MIPLSKREQLLVKLRKGRDVRNACTELRISRASLYRYFNDFPSYKQEVREAMDYADEQARMARDRHLKDDMARIKALITKRKR